MYHLTKKIDNDFSKREDIFLKLIKNNYSKEFILKNIDEIRELVNPKSSQKINLGVTLRNMLAAVSVVGCENNLLIIPQVSGSGCFELDLAHFENDLIKLIIISAKRAFKKKVYIKILINSSGLLVNIKYKTNALPNKYDRANLTYVIKLKGCNSGKKIAFNDYFINRISTVNLTFIDLLNQ